MRISPESLSDETQELARFDIQGRPSQHLQEEEIGEELRRVLSLTRYPKSRLGNTQIRLDDIVKDPETDYDSGSSISLAYDRNGQLKTIVDIPVGRDAIWGVDSLLRSIVPSRRKSRQGQLILKAERLIRATSVALALNDNSTHY